MDRCFHTHGIHEHPTVRHSACVHLPTFSHTFFPIRVDFRCSRRSHRPVRRSARTPPSVLPEKNLQAEEPIRAALPHGCGARRAPDPGPVSASASISATVPTSPFTVLAWPSSRDVRCVEADEWVLGWTSCSARSGVPTRCPRSSGSPRPCGSACPRSKRTGLRSGTLSSSLPRGTGSTTVSPSRSKHRACAVASAGDHPRLIDVLCARRRVGAAVRRDARGQDYPMVLTDGEWLVAFVRAVSGRFFC